MPDDHRTTRARLFWARYTRRPHDQGIKPPFDQWHVCRAKAFIGQFPGRRLGELAAQEVTDYLTWVGHEAAMKPRQFRQLVDAIRMRYSMVRAEWAAGFDWDFWMASLETVGSHVRKRPIAIGSGMVSRGSCTKQDQNMHAQSRSCWFMPTGLRS